MYNPMSLKDKNIIITGAGSGIGRETAIEVCKLGGNALLLDIDEKGLTETLLECSDGSNKLLVDLSDGSLIKESLQTGMKIMGKFSGLVHCAGVPSIIPLRMLTTENYKKVMDVNTFAAIELTKCFTNKKICVGRGSSIVLISSVYGVVGSSCNLAYTASKSAIIGITKSLALELAPKGIRANCVAPGFIKTNMGGAVEYKFDKEYSSLIESMHPLGWGEASDISHGISYLLSDAAKWITGSVINIDGGYTAQ